MFNCRTVTTTVCKTPRNHGSICQNRSKCTKCGLNLLHTPMSWSWAAALSPPQLEAPQVTTDPSARIAAKAPPVAWICCTPLSWSWTAELSPRLSGSPQVTTDPSARIAAKAPPVAWICCTPLSWSWTAELSPPLHGSPQVTTDPSARIAAKAWFRGLNLLHTPELIENCRTATATVEITPGHDRSICQNRSKGPTCGLNLLHAPGADLELLNCLHHCLDHPRSRRIHLPESQQRPLQQWLESAAHPWAGHELPNCHRQSLHNPR